MKFKKVITGIALATAAALSLAAYTTQNAEAASKSSSKTVKVGVMTFSDTEKARWDKIKELVGDKANIEFTEFTDYTQPNEAVANKEIDINAFQHYNFLENWNKENKQNLVAIADTYLAPIRLYSDKVKKVKSIPKNGTIAIPNDATNESRALYLLQSAGLIKLNVSGTEIATVANITKNPKNLNIQELDASQTARSLKDVDAAVINGNYAIPAGLIASVDGLYVEGADSPYVNIIAVKDGNQNNPIYTLD